MDLPTGMKKNMEIVAPSRDKPRMDTDEAMHMLSSTDSVDDSRAKARNDKAAPKRT
jgi:hypothetical protein